ncbi:phosphatidate cytidylyltransferase [Desertibaculum subflavum]|uniref:phosphatidate cytidylyltransferase n=1 Tax=Desertibaculum subflavum TaxID=2268458 RepID=UPI000E668B60
MSSIGANAVSARPASSAVFAGIGLRVASAAVLIPLAVAAVWWGGLVFQLLVAAFACLMLHEWWRLTRDQGAVWIVAGLVYVLVPCFALAWFREATGWIAALWLFVAVWASDTGAYLFGRMIGGPKLWPAVSPNKTWAGLGGAAFGAALVGLIGSFVVPGADLRLIAAGVGIGLLGQAGDLFESHVKRRAGAKDSGTLIPGHGGALDRLDSLLFVAPAAAFVLWQVA